VSSDDVVDEISNPTFGTEVTSVKEAGVVRSNRVVEVTWNPLAKNGEGA